MSKFAQATDVSVEKSRLEIEKILQRYGATGFFYGTEPGKAIVGFRAHDRVVRFNLPLPKMSDFAKDPRRTWASATKEQQEARYQQALRTRWRCLALAVKAKLEVVESGISSFESEFLAHVMTPDGRTVGEQILPRLSEAYSTGKPVPMLLGPAE